MWNGDTGSLTGGLSVPSDRKPELSAGLNISAISGGGGVPSGYIYRLWWSGERVFECFVLAHEESESSQTGLRY